jgi:hypothetical protein
MTTATTPLEILLASPPLSLDLSKDKEERRQKKNTGNTEKKKMFCCWPEEKDHPSAYVCYTWHTRKQYYRNELEIYASSSLSFFYLFICIPTTSFVCFWP